jgi:Flagellar transcriptional activator (FlhC)
VIAQEVGEWNVAMQLIAEGLTPPIVHAVTGLCRIRLRNLYRDIHGKAAVKGRRSKYAYNRLKTRNQVIEGTTYFQMYHGLGGERIFHDLDPDLVLSAYREYKGLSAKNRIDFVTAWYIARDLRENLGDNILTPRLCQVCDREYLYDPRSDLMTRCPLCSG